MDIELRLKDAEVSLGSLEKFREEEAQTDGTSTQQRDERAQTDGTQAARVTIGLRHMCASGHVLPGGHVQLVEHPLPSCPYLLHAGKMRMRKGPK